MIIQSGKQMTQEQLSPKGPWRITDTVNSGRKNLFCFAPNREHHIATIISGSRSELERFEKALNLIREAPQMLQILEDLVSQLRSRDTEALALDFDIEAAELVLDRVRATFSEG